MPSYRTTFTTPYDQFAERRYEPFTVLTVITEPIPYVYDEEVLPMYRIRFMDGTEIDAWPEEVLADV